MLGKWLSFGAGITCVLLVSVLMLYLQGTSRPLPGGRYAEVVVTALVSGLGVSLISWLVMSRYTDEFRKLLSHLEGLGHGDGRTLSYRPGMGLAELAEAFEEATTRLRGRIDQLIGQRRELEVQVRISETERRHAEAIINSITDAVIVTDAFNEMLLANRAASRILDFDLEAAHRRPIDKVISDDTLVKLIKDTREFGRATVPRHAEHRIRDDGHTATYDVSLVCLGSDIAPHVPETAGVVTILRDVTREREIAEMKSEFVSNVSHELRTPLSSIKAYMEMLVDGEADDEQTRTEFYNVIQGETNRLSRLIDNILNISRIESGVVKVQREYISLKGLIRDAIDVMQPQARAKQIELIENVTPTFFQVLADKDMIYQALLNLLGNAIKYTMPRGKVTVGAQVDELRRYVTVSVSDTGVGIPPDDLPHLFSKFYRVADHKKIAKGTGLGLNLVKQIIETVHGGKIVVVSELSKGSTFSFSLPLAEGTR